MKLPSLPKQAGFVRAIPNLHPIIILLFALLLSACGATDTSDHSSATSSSANTATPAAPLASPTVPTASTPIQLTPTSQATATATFPLPSLAPTENARPVSVFPESQNYTWVPMARGLQKPVDLTHAGDGSDRLFVVEQAGLIRILQQGRLNPSPFLDITDRVGSGGFEQGLLGLAFHPKYNEKGTFYVNYTDLQGSTIIARFQVSPDDPNRADPASELRLFEIPQPYANHNGGSVVFGPDGFLYLGLGDGGSAGDPLGNGQSLDTLLGKILRIDVDSEEPYTIPPDNPFALGGGRPEIWAYGLRNPWRFSFDRQTGDLYLADVGQNAWEEVNFLSRDELVQGKSGSAEAFNFGWNFFEGNAPFSGSPPPGLKTIAPVAEYDHSEGCSVTGGFVYRGNRLPEWQGIYFFGDYCSGTIWGLLRDEQGNWISQVLFQQQGRIASFGEDEGGEIYVIDHAGGVSQLIR